MILSAAVFAAAFGVMRLLDKPPEAAKPLDVMKGIDRAPVEQAVNPPPREAEAPPVAVASPVNPEPAASPPPEQPSPTAVPPAAAVAPVAHSGGTDAQLTPQGAAADLLQRIKAGDIAGFFTNYMPPSVFARMPEAQRARLAEQAVEMTTPGTRGYERMQAMIAGLESIQGTAPTINEAGDRAVYPLANPIEGSPSNITFTLENGKWYVR